MIMRMERILRRGKNLMLERFKRYLMINRIDYILSIKKKYLEDITLIETFSLCLKVLNVKKGMMGYVQGNR